MQKQLRAVTPTQGQRILQRWLDPAKGRTKTWLAKQLGVSQPAVTAWVKGTSRPSTPALRKALASLIGAPEESWDTAEERTENERMLRRVENVPPPDDSGHRVAKAAPRTRTKTGTRG